MDNNTRCDLIFFTGAGISVASGIPTFEDQPGLRSKLERNFALTHPDEYRSVISEMKAVCDAAEPNAAHYAIAEMNCPVITMNIDGLHRKAKTTDLIELHGRLPNDNELNADNLNRLMNIPVLYGDPAPEYQHAYSLIRKLKYSNSFLVIVGTSFYTHVSEEVTSSHDLWKSGLPLVNDNKQSVLVR